MRVGIFLTNQHPVGRDMVRGLDEQLAMLHAARDAGWDSAWVPQHYLSDGVAMLQPAPYLARLAADAGDMTLGLGIMLLALHNPLDVAETVASLDVICRGRLIFGVGLGYRDAEYNAFGITRSERVRRFEENLRLVQALWTGEKVDADLPWCRLNGASLTIRPVQRPHPPIWIAANNDVAVKRAARLGDAWLINPHATRATIAGQLAIFREVRGAHGRPPAAETPLIREVFCAPDRATAHALAGPNLSAKYQVYANWGQDKAMPGQESFDIPFDALEADRFVVGTPDDCLRALLPWRDELGIDHLIIRSHWSGMPVEHALQSIKLLAREVMPVLRQT